MFDFFHPLKSFERQRNAWKKRNRPPEHLSTLLIEAIPAIEEDASTLDYLVLDLETTGLDPSRDRILSIGMVTLNGMVLDMKTAREVYIKDDKAIRAETAVINHIVPEMTREGVSLDQAMDQLFEDMRNRVVIAHGMGIEQRFIHSYVQSRFGLKELPLLWLDTLRLEKSLLKNRLEPNSNDYTLSGIRSRYNLPDYPAHEALVDAVATGELFLVLLKQIFSNSTPCFGELYQRSH